VIIQIELVSIDKKEILINLFEKYNYEFSQYEDTDVEDNGLYPLKNLDTFFAEETGFAYFIKANNKFAGFILVDKHKDSVVDYSINEFFVMYKYKRKGVGTYGIKNICNKHKGKWEIKKKKKNKPANEFWNTIVNDYTNGRFEIIKDHFKYNDGLIRDKLIFNT
jgi:predicted acetyltransferase